MKNLSSPHKENDDFFETSSKSTEEDKILDLTLRPKKWDEFIGQEKIKRNIQIILEAAKKRGDPSFEHILFYGNSGLGKTSLAYLIAKEVNSNIKTITGTSVQKTGDLAAILTNLNEGDILFCDEVHRLNKQIEEFLYPALEDFHLNLILGTGPMARTMDLKLPHFTFIAATTRVALLSSPLRNRFGAIFQLDFYSEEDIKEIIKRSSNLLNIKIDNEAINIIAKCSRFTPRVANRLLKRIRDFAQVEGKGIIDKEITLKSLDFLEIDEFGLEAGDRRILETIIKKFNGGPVGLQALSSASSEEEDAILDIYEPYLMKLGFIERTPRGRIATKNAYKHLGIKYNSSQDTLL
ncbi:MAG: Holliday junction branch migration DNA helicase RuvB [Candidatus Pacebacteria bacterium]|nr:Holliday junction branch migration DNA helicase RuvB [Candidatus Paceibacterota bacterium]HOW12927.1 Holliday junction branch migration DNA helicase RuvB [Candidatus Pacearchaeota archaeon]